jgi:hypothetical protein
MADREYVNMLTRLLILALVFMVYLGCDLLGDSTLKGDALDGRVVEESSGKPIPDAIVLAYWKGFLPGWGHGKSVCYHVLSTTTNNAGTFHFPPWRERVEDWRKRIKDKETYIIAYKSGYEWSQLFSHDGITYLRPFGGSRGARMEYLRRVLRATDCASAGISAKNLHLLYRALYEDAKKIAVTKKDKEFVQILADATTMDLGDGTEPTGADQEQNADAKEHQK